MKTKLLFISIITLLLSTTLKCFAQQPAANDSIYYITTKDGTTINGTLHEKNEKQISINTRNFGVVNIVRDSIRQLQVLDPSSYKNGKFFFPNPNSTRYFYSPSAIPMKKGEGYFQNTYLFLCSVNYGLSYHISIGAGIDVLTPFLKFNFAGTSLKSGGPIALATLKAGFEVAKNFYVAGTTVLMHTPYLGNEYNVTESTYLFENLAFTAGTTDVNVTAGIAYGLNNGEWMGGPSYTISGMARVSPRFSLVSENWVVPVAQYDNTYDWSTNTNNYTYTGISYYGFVSYGMRFMSQKIAVDFGFINSGDIAKNIAIGIPYVDFVVKF